MVFLQSSQELCNKCELSSEGKGTFADYWITWREKGRRKERIMLSGQTALRQLKTTWLYEAIYDVTRPLLGFGSMRFACMRFATSERKKDNGADVW